MTDALRSKLLEILQIHKKSHAILSDSAAIGSIEQAFVNEGYVRIPDVLVGGDETITVNNERVMTSQEWYRAFEKELTTMYLIRPGLGSYMVEVMGAARKAAGIDHE